MKNLQTLQLISNLFSFKVICDKKGTEYVVFKNSTINNITEDIRDRTAFEAQENHVHLLDHIRKKEVDTLAYIGSNLAKALLHSLKAAFIEKDFVVFLTISINDSMIIRFHQRWNNEEYYYNIADESPDSRIIMFES